MANRLLFTPDARLRFLDHLRKSCNISASARVAGVSRECVYKVRSEDDQFATEWDDAIEEALDALEAEVRRRAFDGVAEPVFWQGMEVGTIRKYSDGLAQFFLKAYRDRFKDKQTIEHTGSVNVATRIIDSRKRAGSTE